MVIRKRVVEGEGLPQAVVGYAVDLARSVCLVASAEAARLLSANLHRSLTNTTRTTYKTNPLRGLLL
jgi:hypothetical protein